MRDTLFSSISHVTLHDGKISVYKKQSIPGNMYDEIFSLFPGTICEKGSNVGFYDKSYRIQTNFSGDGGITKLYIKMKNPSWAEAHLMTCGYSRTDYKIFDEIIGGRLGEKLTIQQPALPYLISRVEPGIIMDKTCLEWLSPFARCVAWIALDPRNYIHFIK